MEHIVAGCIDCPLNSNDREYGDACLHPSASEDIFGRPLPEDAENGYKTITPDWCPLNKEPITIRKINNDVLIQDAGLTLNLDAYKKVEKQTTV